MTVELDDLLVESDSLAGDEGRPIVLEPSVADRNERLDRFVSLRLPEVSRGQIQRLIDDGEVRVDGLVRRRSFKVTPGQRIAVAIPEPTVEEIEPEAIPLTVLYEDADVLVLDKIAGMVVHPAPGHARGTLVNALLHHVPGISVGGTNRPGIVHRLDKDTSGVMVVAKSDRGRNALVEQWSRQAVEKTYLALVAGEVEPDEATIDVPIARDPQDRLRMAPIATGRRAVSHLRVLDRFGPATLLEVAIETGRTHQIRVHLAFIGHPVVGDALYNRKSGPYGGANSISSRQFLHASRLAFALPDGRAVSFASSLPADLEAVLQRVRRDAYGAMA